MEKITHKGRIIEVVQKEVEHPSAGSGQAAGKKMTFEYARRSPGVRLIVPKGNQILLTKEFRAEVGGYDYRLPGGKVYDSLDEYNTALASGVDIAEAAKKAAIKEAHEEIGVDVKDLSFFHKSICGATVIWDLFYFIVHDFTQTEQHLEAGEDISIEFFDKDEVRKMCLSGAMSEERSALVLLRYLEGK